MRMMFGLLGLVLTLFVVMQLVKTQTAPEVPVATPPADAPSTPQGNPKQMQEQYQQALDGALKQGRRATRQQTNREWDTRVAGGCRRALHASGLGRG